MKVADNLHVFSELYSDIVIMLGDVLSRIGEVFIIGIHIYI